MHSLFGNNFTTSEKHEAASQKGPLVQSDPSTFSKEHEDQEERTGKAACFVSRLSDIDSDLDALDSSECYSPKGRLLPATAAIQITEVCLPAAYANLAGKKTVPNHTLHARQHVHIPGFVAAACCHCVNSDLEVEPVRLLRSEHGFMNGKRPLTSLSRL